MKSNFPVILAVGLIVCGCSEKKETASPAPPPAKAEAAPGNNPLTAPVDYLGAVAKAKKTADATLDSAALNQQVQLFYGQEGRYPKDLNELVTEKYLKSLPTPPHGTKLEYNPANGQVKVVKE
jgi:hypothetical protein